MKRVVASVLVADDEAANRLLLTEILQDDYKVILAKNGAQALQRVAQYRPRMVLLDVFMPDMSGFEVLDALRAQPATSRLPVVFVTTPDTLSETQRQGLRQAADVICKPPRADVVRACVARILLKQPRRSAE